MANQKKYAQVLDGNGLPVCASDYGDLAIFDSMDDAYAYIEYLREQCDMETDDYYVANVKVSPIRRRRLTTSVTAKRISGHKIMPF